MDLSDASWAYLSKVFESEELLRQDTCTGAMQAVAAFLGEGAGAPMLEFNTARDGLYTLTLNFGADINTPGHVAGWEHGLALQRIGEDLVLYQAWAGAFTLGDWVGVRGPVHGLAAAVYSPMHAQNSRARMKAWLHMLENLPATASGNYAAFGASAELLFGPSSHAGTGLVMLRHLADRPAPLRLHWTHRPLKAIRQVR